MTPLPKAYDPLVFEPHISEKWEQNGAFHADNSSDAPPFTISMPPPNATGQLHVGHAVMLALEDILIRWRRMSGYEALWVPGTDHAAIATENVVLKQIQLDERIEDPRSQLGREEVLKRIAEYVDKSRGTIRNQVKAMGSSCDWSRERYTMDPQLNRCVNEVFTRMFEQGLIYRGVRIVNWDPTLQTTISDDEIDHRETSSTLYYLQYGPFEVATSRPETKLGDTGIAVHPDDERYREYVGKTLTVTWPKGQSISVKVFADRQVDPEFGTGVIGVTPAHSQVDFQMAQQHGLQVTQVIDENGRMAENTGSYAGMTVLQCRETFVRDLEEAGLLVNTETYQQSLSICYRSKHPIEPLPKEQWFINVNKPVVPWHGKNRSLREILIEVVRSGEIRLVPDRFDSTYFNWVENLQDWCISRQIWWGHRVPVYYRGEEMRASVVPPNPGDGWEQDPDTLDTWFSSALWTWSTLVDAELAKDETLSFEELLHRSPDYRKFHPTQVMETGYDILFFWVARMILMTTYMVQEVPFETVYLHGLVRTREGKKMSKSDPDTCIDPLESIEQYGTDALRLALILGTGPGQDLRLYPEKLESCRRFANKIWNAGRYILMTIPRDTRMEPPETVNSPIAQWLLHELDILVAQAQEGLEAYRLADVVDTLKGFFWGLFCDWYLEMDKRPQRSEEDNRVLAHAFGTLLKLLHPYVPFVTEALWENLPREKMLAHSSWPVSGSYYFPYNHARIELIRDAVSNIRALRDKANIGMDRKVDARIDSALHADVFREQKNLITRLARLNSLTVSEAEAAPGGDSLTAYFSDTLVRIDASAVDWDREMASLQKQLHSESTFLEKSRGKLDNPGFLKNAPESVVSELRTKVGATEKTIDALRRQLRELERLAG